jgi:hypothetical protein
MPVSLVEIQPYLNPDYWEGFEIGVNVPQPQHSTFATSRARNFAADHIASSVAQGGTEIVYRRYDKQTTFDCGLYAVGALVAFRREQLYLSTLHGNYVPMRQAKGTPLPFPNTSLAVDIEDPLSPTNRTAYSNHGFQYFDQIYYGMVARLGYFSKILLSIPATQVRVDAESSTVKRKPEREPTEFTIGKVIHYFDESIGREVLTRVNVLAAYSQIEPNPLHATSEWLIQKIHNSGLRSESNLSLG